MKRIVANRRTTQFDTSLKETQGVLQEQTLRIQGLNWKTHQSELNRTLDLQGQFQV